MERRALLKMIGAAALWLAAPLKTLARRRFGARARARRDGRPKPSGKAERRRRRQPDQDPGQLQRGEIPRRAIREANPFLIGDSCMAELHKIVPDGGSYVSESNFFNNDWQRAYWGTNCKRLASIKRRYDPDGLFTEHNGVGAEWWSRDGFVRL